METIRDEYSLGTKYFQQMSDKPTQFPNNKLTQRIILVAM